MSEQQKFPTREQFDGVDALPIVVRFEARQAGKRSLMVADLVIRAEKAGVPIEVQGCQQPTREQIADLIPLSLLDGRDPRKNVFEVADQILALFQNGANQ